MKKAGMLGAGFLCVILGVALVLKEWSAVVAVFNGVIGALLAILGLVLLSLVKE